jgi:hypothetical protein
MVLTTSTSGLITVSMWGVCWRKGVVVLIEVRAPDAGQLLGAGRQDVGHQAGHQVGFVLVGHGQQDLGLRMPASSSTDGLLPLPVMVCTSMLSATRRMASASLSTTTTSLFSRARRPAI